MKNTLIAVTLLILIYGCKSSTKQSPIKERPDTEARPGNKITLDIQAPQLIDSSKYVIYPLIKERAEEEYGSSSSGHPATYWNLIFYNAETKEYHLLDTAKMIINSFGNDTDEKNAENSGLAKKFIFYSVTTCDYNKDGTLDDDDPQYLFISDKSGNKFVQISPDSLNVTEWHFVKGTGKVLIQTVRDVNNDKKFDNDDEQIAFVYDLAKGGKAEQVFSKDFELNTKKLYHKLWHK